MAGNEFVGFSNATFLSEKSCADQNFAIGYFLKEHGVFPEGSLFFFFNQFYECVFSRQNFFNGDVRSDKSKDIIRFLEYPFSGSRERHTTENSHCNTTFTIKTWKLFCSCVYPFTHLADKSQTQ